MRINTLHFLVFILTEHFNRVTVAGDGEVRVFDVGSGSHLPRYGPTSGDANRDVVRIIQCHCGPVKRIVTEESPDIFLTVSEVREPQLLRLHVRSERLVGRDCPPA